jgi:hypothetical protein
MLGYATFVERDHAVPPPRTVARKRSPTLSRSAADV